MDSPALNPAGLDLLDDDLALDLLVDIRGKLGVLWKLRHLVIFSLNIFMEEGKYKCIQPMSSIKVPL